MEARHTNIPSEDQQPNPPEQDFLTRIASNVHVFDKSGRKIIGLNPYSMKVVGGKEFIEYPKGSGNLFHSNGDRCGRKVDGKIDTKADHIHWEPPKSAEEKALMQKNLQVERLQKQLQEVSGKQAAVQNNINAKLSKLEKVSEHQAKAIEDKNSEIQRLQNELDKREAVLAVREAKLGEIEKESPSPHLKPNKPPGVNT